MGKLRRRREEEGRGKREREEEGFHCPFPTKNG
jgi:hypothetical protein